MTPHPHLVARTVASPEPPEATWSHNDTLYVVLLIAAVVFCTIVPFAAL
jgi:hypothetical protein